jgi:hypothetical protein
MARRRGWLGAVALSACWEGQAPPGDLAAFRPVAALEDVAAFAGPGAELVGMSARYVLSDGTLDLSAAYKPEVRYTFRARATRADVDAMGPQPPGAGMREGDPVEVSVTVRRPDSPFRQGKGLLGRGMRRSAGRASGVAEPAVRCDPGALWAAAIARGASAGAAATLHYAADGVRFEIAEPSFSLRFDAACAPVGAGG